MKTHFFVTTRRIKHPDFHCRCIGFYNSLKDARGVLRRSWDMLQEAGYYQYAIIEEFGPGWYPQAETEEWYKFIENRSKSKCIGFKKIKKPKKYNRVCNFGIG